MKLNAWNMSDGTVHIHAAGCNHKPGSGRGGPQRQDQVEFGKVNWTSQEAFGFDYWNNGILEENEADSGPGSFDVFQDMEFKPCVDLPVHEQSFADHVLAGLPPVRWNGVKVTHDEVRHYSDGDSIAVVDGSREDCPNCNPKENEVAQNKAPRGKATGGNATKETLGKAPGEVPAPTAHLATKGHAIDGKCRCGCGQVVGKGSTFKQGHDARWISNLVAKVVSGDLTEAHAAKETGEVSSNLKVKLEKAVTLAKAKAEKSRLAAEAKAAAKVAAEQAAAAKAAEGAAEK
jgi:hypothetical protein